MNPNFPISQPQGFDSPCHCWHLCAFILGRKPLSAGLKPEFWSFKLRLPQSAKTAASLHQLEKTLRPRLPDYTRLYLTTRPFRSLKMSKQIKQISLVSHIPESHGKSSTMLHTAPVLPKIAKACVRVRRN